ncbi:hypothetical protein JCM17823_17600 [Halorubrum gandharaense]
MPTWHMGAGGDGRDDEPASANDHAPLAERSVGRTEGAAVGSRDERSGGSGDDDDRPVGSEIAVEFPARDPDELDDATELYLMDQHAAPDGTVTAQVLGWEREGDTVRVDYALPTGERRSDRYRWPTPGRYDDSDFLRLVRGLGYIPGTAEHVAGEFARARREHGHWRLVTGRQWDGGGNVGRDDAAASGTEAGAAEVDGWVASRLPHRLRRWLAGVEPMDLATAGVVAVFLAASLPAALAAATGGLSTGLVALGAGLVAVFVITLWLALVAAEM